MRSGTGITSFTSRSTMAWSSTWLTALSARRGLEEARGGGEKAGSSFCTSSIFAPKTLGLISARPTMPPAGSLLGALDFSGGAFFFFAFSTFSSGFSRVSAPPTVGARSEETAVSSIATSAADAAGAAVAASAVAASAGAGAAASSSSGGAMQCLASGLVRRLGVLASTSPPDDPDARRRCCCCLRIWTDLKIDTKGVTPMPAPTTITVLNSQTLCAGAPKGPWSCSSTVPGGRFALSMRATESSVRVLSRWKVEVACRCDRSKETSKETLIEEPVPLKELSVKGKALQQTLPLGITIFSN
mmetsp:Transcript_65043/g.103506  ORF Transcript_65043/g.103506 Transcript_65043/m.103506 type:complete len:301 (+) Transcript_65043:434-1336(+)